MVFREKTREQIRDFHVVEIRKWKVRIPLYAYFGQMQKLRMTAMPVYRIHKRLGVSEGLGEKGGLIKIVAVDELDRDLRQFQKIL
jgi:hypothetical protein